MRVYLDSAPVIYLVENVPPYATLVNAFDRYLAEIMTEIVPLSRAVIDYATELRARYNFKTPDAIHLAAAIYNSCDVFLTNDYQLQQCAEISIEVV